MSVPAQSARRTRGQLLVACLAMALPAFAASASAVESPALPTCSFAVSSVPVADTVVPHEPAAPNAERGFAMAGFEPGSGFFPLVAIGSRFDGLPPSDGGVGGGAVYLFMLTPRTFEEQFHCDSTQPGEQFGISVALHGNNLAVGAPGQQQTDHERPGGTVYVFNLTSSAPSDAAVGDGGLQIARTDRIADFPAGLASLGSAIALDDQWLAVSATMPGAGGVRGAVLLYQLPYVPGSTPLVLMPPMPQAGDRFGESLAFSDDGTLIAGAPGRSGKAGQAAAGAVYLFPLAPPADSKQPVGEVGELRPPQEAADAQFGASLSASGSSLAVGAVGAGAPAGLPLGGPGAVYVFTLGNGTWTQQAVLAPDPAHAVSGERFGQAVAINGDFLVVGAPLSLAATFAGGAGFLFQFQAGVWAEVPGATVDGTATHGLFGSAVALLSHAALVGAPLENQGMGVVHYYPVGVPETTAGAAAARSLGVPAARSSRRGAARRSAAAPSRNAGEVTP
jgi:hypothetical protein